jgi:hypothetical protein
MELLLLVLAGFIGYFIGSMVTVWRLREFFKEAAKAEGIDVGEDFVIKEQKPTEIYKLEIEEINNTLYLFERETHNFICQGSTLEELAKLSKDYKNIALATVIHRNKVFMFVNGLSKEYTG